MPSTNPLTLCKDAFTKAEKLSLKNPYAIALATANSKGIPSVRMVLLKEITPNGFLFYTNYQSRKGLELQENPYASFVAYWESLDLQIRVEGSIKKLPKEKNENYFHSRPKGSQVSALLSPQSQKISSYKELQEKFIHLLSKYEEKTVSLPDYWGGYELLPTVIEFWREGKNRLHKRERYTKKSTDQTSWEVDFLAP